MSSNASPSSGSRGRILITGASGKIGSRLVNYLHHHGYACISADIVPLPEHVPQPLPEGSSFCLVDVTDYLAVEELFTQTLPKHPETASNAEAEPTTNSVPTPPMTPMKPCSPLIGVIHLSAYPNPTGLDPRAIHNLNVRASYNVLRTAADHGVKRIVQASSVNATGLNFTAEERKVEFGWVLPVDEGSECRPEDAYSLSKQICEIQADSICRTHPSLRITFFRLGFTTDRSIAIKYTRKEDLWGYTSFAAASSACLLGLTSRHPEFESGHEAFYVLDDKIILGDESLEVTRRGWADKIGPGRKVSEVGTRELLEIAYPGTKTKEGWFDGPGNERRALHDSEKAKRLLGWKHVEVFEGGDAFGLKG